MGASSVCCVCEANAMSVSVTHGSWRISLAIIAIVKSKKKIKECLLRVIPRAGSVDNLNTKFQQILKSFGKPVKCQWRKNIFKKATKKWCCFLANDIVNMMVVSRETTISSNIRAIIEQLNLNPVERRRLIDYRGQESVKSLPVPAVVVAQPRPRVTIGVYGCKQPISYQICDRTTKRDPPTKCSIKITVKQKPSSESRQRAVPNLEQVLIVSPPVVVREKSPPPKERPIVIEDKPVVVDVIIFFFL